LLREAKRRIAARPERYVDHVYGEKEAGGTGWLYLSRVPFEKLGFPTSFENPDTFKKVRLGSRERNGGFLASVRNGT
jgi:formate dehydrogenase iron-sulfur subunit